MSGDGAITLAWGDGEHRFRLGIGELRELQDKCGAGPFVVYQRLSNGEWHVDDVREPLRLGLIGGGLDAQRAMSKVARYVTPGAFLENVIAARRIVMAGLFGDPDDALGKLTAAAAAAETLNQTAESNSAGLSEMPQPSAGQSTSLTGQAFGSSAQPSLDGMHVTAAKPNGQNP